MRNTERTRTRIVQLTLLAVLIPVASERASAVTTSYWQDVAGDLNGNWTNVAHWSNADVPDTTNEYPYITTNSATPFTITLDSTDNWANNPAALKAIYIAGSNAKLKIDGVTINEMESFIAKTGSNITVHLTDRSGKLRLAPSSTWRYLMLRGRGGRPFVLPYLWHRMSLIHPTASDTMPARISLDIGYHGQPGLPVLWFNIGISGRIALYANVRI